METSCQPLCDEKLLTSSQSYKRAMDTAALSAWVKAEKAKGLSERALGKAVGVSGTAVGRWLKGEVNSLQPGTVSAIAAYRGESIDSTYYWLKLPQPVDTGDAGRIEVLERKYEEILSLLGHINERLTEGFLRPDPLALLIQDELYRALYDLRTKTGYSQFLEACTDNLDGDGIMAQKIVSQLIGAVPISRDDYTFLSMALRPILGDKWTTRYLMEQALKAKDKYDA